MKTSAKRVEISYRTIIFTAIFLATVWLLYQVREILLMLFISVILVGALNPLVSRLENKGVSRWLSILFIYSVLLAVVILTVAGLIPPLVDQTSRFVQVIIDLSNKLSFLGFTSDKLQTQIQGLGGLPTQIVKLVVSVFSNVIAIFGILVTTFYLLLEHKNLNHYLSLLFGSEKKKRARLVVDQVEKKLGGWVRAELLLMTVVGVLSYIGFRILKLRFALPLAILSGFLELIPTVGPTVAAIPAVGVGLMESPLVAILVTAWCLIVQQLENNLIVPKIMEKSVGVNPLVTLLSLAVGFKLAGVIGALLAIPIYLAIETIVLELPALKKAKGE